MTYIGTERIDDFFEHHGIKGQRWGVRRYQNEDGTLTELGKKRYNKISEKYIDKETGKFSTRKSTKLDLGIRTGYGAAATGAALAGALSNPIGLGALLGTGAAVGAKSIVGAVKRERARKFLENTGTGNNEDINADRRYATSVDPFFSLVPLGSIANLSYGTHREKVAAEVKKRLENTSIEEATKQNEKTREFTSLEEVSKISDQTVKEKYGKNSRDIDVYVKPGLHPFSNNPISIEKRKKEWEKIFNEEVNEYEKNMDAVINQVKGKTKDSAYKKLLTSSPELINIDAAARKIANAKTPEEESKAYMDMWNKMDKQKEKMLSKIYEDAKKDKSNALLYDVLEDRVESASDTDPFVDRLQAAVNKARKENSMSHSGIPGMHWYQRRWQNPDGSLTPAGRIRYLKKAGGSKTIQKKEKERIKTEIAKEKANVRKEKILSDPKKLYRHKNEFSKEDLDKAMAKFESQNRLKAQIEADKAARQKAKAAYKQSKLDYKKMKLQQEIDREKAEEERKRDKMATKQKEIETANKADDKGFADSERWKNRSSKFKNIFEFAQNGKKILDDLGITNSKAGSSLFGDLGVSLGFKDPSAKKDGEGKSKDGEGKGKGGALNQTININVSEAKEKSPKMPGSSMSFSDISGFSDWLDGKTPKTYTTKSEPKTTHVMDSDKMKTYANMVNTDKYFKEYDRTKSGHRDKRYSSTETLDKLSLSRNPHLDRVKTDYSDVFNDLFSILNAKDLIK